MSAFLARAVTTAKWKERDIGGHMTIPAQGITNDMRVSNDRLSFWTCDPSHSPSLEQVVLTLAATRDTVDRLDLVWIDEAAIKAIPLRIVTIEGKTPAQSLRDRHRDVAGIDLGAIYKLARDVAKAVNGAQTKRWTRAEVKRILKEAAGKKSLDMDGVGANIRSEIESA